MEAIDLEHMHQVTGGRNDQMESPPTPSPNAVPTGFGDRAYRFLQNVGAIRYRYPV